MTSPADSTPLDASLLRAWPMPIRQGGDKFSRGTTMVIGGSARTPGAVRLAGEAALRMGAGRLQIATAADVAAPLGVAVPEALVASLSSGADGGLQWNDDAQLGTMLAEADAVLVGPGLLGDPTELVVEVLQRVNDQAIVVLDARALACLVAVPAHLVPRGRLALTPNRQELDGLAVDGRRHDGELDGDEDDHASALHVAHRFGATVTCFGRVTASHEQWDMGAGSPGLGTSGSGDVLAGLVVGAAARCGDLAQAVCWATFAHAEAGASLAARAGELSFLARELVTEVPLVVGNLESSTSR